MGNQLTKQRARLVGNKTRLLKTKLGLRTFQYHELLFPLPSIPAVKVKVQRTMPRSNTREGTKSSFYIFKWSKSFNDNCKRGISTVLPKEFVVKNELLWIVRFGWHWFISLIIGGAQLIVIIKIEKTIWCNSKVWKAFKYFIFPSLFRDTPWLTNHHLMTVARYGGIQTLVTSGGRQHCLSPGAGAGDNLDTGDIMKLII